MSKVEKFEDLEVWVLAREICSDLEELFESTPLGKRYSLMNQMDRSSGSIMDNIAEGFGRGGNLEFRNFLSFSRGSCTELKSQLYRARDKNLISEDEFQRLASKCEREIAKITAFIAFLNRSNLKGSKFKKDQGQ
ncbi:four helix bundle protein [Salinimicrobium catena]|uniref:Four helix bundle protein n=1 Tax=Salinimicrobium catena TaxID=390640 RepID=A0A1H5NBZ0_9FLAO|nr:four helix bundle protein [Salinimicrobium catena]SDL40788.1 four helix bundle protein [Salinimicrobium catena]SEE98381.1 four helix bundle protein [Salinimicrobium catena]